MLPDKKGYFGIFGGKFVPETLMPALAELEARIRALVRRGQLEILFVAAEGKAQMRLVRSGKQTAQGIEILAGLASGETVVVEGVANLRDGQPLQIQ